jgi:hypothetical protein
MARTRDEREVAVATCDKCRSEKRNSQVYHILSFADLHELRSHLNEVFGKGEYCVDFFTTMWVTIHQIYGDRAKELQQPLWLVYFEAHGITVKNRGESIIKYRSTK